MSSKGMSLKGRINHYAKQNGIAAQVVLQNYMFERFLERLSRSEYQQKFVIKGGMLVTAIVGIDTRATMDLDTTLRNLPLTEPQIREAITAICSVHLDDEVSFQIVSVEPILIRFLPNPKKQARSPARMNQTAGLQFVFILQSKSVSFQEPSGLPS